MRISLSAANRMIEEKVATDEASRRTLEKSGRLVLSQVRKLSTDELQAELGRLGVTLDPTSFEQETRRFLSAEQMALAIEEQAKTRLSNRDSDMLWCVLTVLWERWQTERPSLERIDDLMQEGYELEDTNNDEAGACRIWAEVWRHVLRVMDEAKITTIEAFDELFGGSQSVFNWVQDYELALYNAAIGLPELHEQRSALCTEFLKRFGKDDDLTTQNMLRAKAESLAAVGRMEEAEAIFRPRLEEDPTWGLGWIGWSDLFSPAFARDPVMDAEKAERLLKEGLSVPNVRDREMILERLQELYEELGRQEEALALRRERDSLVKQSRSESAPAPAPTRLAGKPKIGRNDPCPCGSGKKYKKCCGSA
ncbi:MAG: SEC-C metal-binding domain-containing protein [Planctomycetota bacterium]